MDMLKRQRIAGDDEKSTRLIMQGYDPKTCSGKCIVHSTATPKEITGKEPLFL